MTRDLTVGVGPVKGVEAGATGAEEEVARTEGGTAGAEVADGAAEGAAVGTVGAVFLAAVLRVCMIVEDKERKDERQSFYQAQDQSHVTNGYTTSPTADLRLPDD